MADDALTRKGAERVEADGWCYSGGPSEGDDARKLVTLEQGGMAWVGIRAWHLQWKSWMNNGEPERANVVAWRDLPERARGFWVRGQLHFSIMPSVQP